MRKKLNTLSRSHYPLHPPPPSRLTVNEIVSFYCSLQAFSRPFSRPSSSLDCLFFLSCLSFLVSLYPNLCRPGQALSFSPYPHHAQPSPHLRLQTQFQLLIQFIPSSSFLQPPAFLSFPFPKQILHHVINLIPEFDFTECLD